MGNKISMFTQMKIQESKGFEIIGTSSNDNSKEELLKNIEYNLKIQFFILIKKN